MLRNYMPATDLRLPDLNVHWFESLEEARETIETAILLSFNWRGKRRAGHLLYNDHAG